MPHLLLTIRFHDGRYHGAGDWPPSPGRLFQALVAAAARGRNLDPADAHALRWLEGLGAPIICAPVMRRGQAYSSFVPNNDLDAVGGHPARIAKLRTGKSIRPLLFEAITPFHYSWEYDPTPAADEAARRICALAEQLYQLGRGVDMAYATGDVVDTLDVSAWSRPGVMTLHRPYANGRSTRGKPLNCPATGTLDSLITRFEQSGKRFSEVRQARKPTKNDPRPYKVTGTIFSQPPKPLLQSIAYDCPPELLAVDIRKPDGSFAALPVDRIVPLTGAIRNRAAEQLETAYRSANSGPLANLVGPVFIGRGAGEADKTSRIRIIPLPSIGHQHVNPAIRRVLIIVPPDCPLPLDDIKWVFSGGGEETIDQETGEVNEHWRLVADGDTAMLKHYGIDHHTDATLWQSVTPLALATAPRRRIDPHRKKEEAKKGAERANEETAAICAVKSALRHEGISTPVEAVTIQREPFSGRGRRAELFAPGTRFAKEALWHVRIEFATPPPTRPIVLGDGRYLGLGLMQPVVASSGLIAWQVAEGFSGAPDPLALTRALRRAVMARVQAEIGKGPLPLFFSGHAPDGSPARPGHHAHIAVVFEPETRRLVIIAPHRLEHRAPVSHERKHWGRLLSAMADFCSLRAGHCGKLSLGPTRLTDDDPLIASAVRWRSVTPYRVNRHARRKTARDAIASDLAAALGTLGLPTPAIEIGESRGEHGLEAEARLTFPQPVQGPILIGRTRHFGGGLFVADRIL